MWFVTTSTIRNYAHSPLETVTTSLHTGMPRRADSAKSLGITYHSPRVQLIGKVLQVVHCSKIRIKLEDILGPVAMIRSTIVGNIQDLLNNRGYPDLLRHQYLSRSLQVYLDGRTHGSKPHPLDIVQLLHNPFP